MSDETEHRLRQWFRQPLPEEPEWLHQYVARVPTTRGRQHRGDRGMLFKRTRVVLGGIAALLVAVVVGGSLLVALNGRPAASPGGSQSPSPSPSGTAGGSVQPTAMPTFKSRLVGSMTSAREGGTATLLEDGRVLIAGGRNDDTFLATAELYDPTTATFSPTGSMTAPRVWGSAVRLKDGRVLMVGGNGLSSLSGISLEVYDPGTGRFIAVGPESHPNPTCPPGGQCGEGFGPPREGLTATVLSDGRVLIAGGTDYVSGFYSIAVASIFDPQTGSLTPTGSMTPRRQGHSAVLLGSGQVLVVGGTPPHDDRHSVNVAELYDPATGTFRATGSLTVPRTDPAVSLLFDGRVLVAGGYQMTSATEPNGLASAEVYDPTTGEFTQSGSMTTARSEATATPLPDGRVLIAGGMDNTSTLATLELFDPSTGAFSPGGSMTQEREGQYAVLLKDGSVLIAGGFENDTTRLVSAEVWGP